MSSNSFRFPFAVVARAAPVSETVALKAGDDVEVGMEDDLAGDEFVVHFNVDAVSTNRFFYGDGKFLKNHHHMGEGVVGDVVKVG